MKNEFFIAIRNLLNNPRRTSLTLAIIAISLGAILFVGGYVEMVRVGFAEQLIRSQYGHFQIYSKGFSDLKDSNETSLLLSEEDVRTLEDILSDLDQVDFFISRLPVQGLIGNGSRSLIFSGIAGEPIEENMMSYGQVLEGNRLDPTKETSVLLGSKMAEKLKANIGDILTITSPNEGGGMEAALVEVSGIMNYGPEGLNNSFIITSLETGKQLHYTDKIQRIVVLLHDTEKTKETILKIQEKADSMGLSIEIREWEEMAVFYRKVIRDYTAQINVLAIVLLLLGGLAVSNTIFMSVMDRIPEIGALRAIGISAKEIMTTIIFEGLLLGLGGMFLGSLLGFGIQFFLENFTIMLPPPPGTYKGIHLTIIINKENVLQKGLLISLITILASLPPAIQGIKANIIEALRR